MKKRIVSTLLAIGMTSMMLAGCGRKEELTETAETTDKEESADKAENTDKTETKDDADNAKEDEDEAKDVIKALLPPVSATYQEMITDWIADFEKENPNLKVEITTASWEDATQKLDVQVNAGSPPDVAFIGSDGLSKYLDAGMAVDISKYMEKEQIADFDENVLNYFRNGDGLYGLPAYCEVQCIGGNKEKLEAAGIDWKTIQKEGWTFEEFREAIKKGVVKSGDDYSTYGFVFACSGVTAKDYFSIFVKNAEMPAAFDKELKYSYTSKKMLSFLEDLKSLIDDGSMPSTVGSIDAGKRWNMLLTGQTMITGKGLSSFERSAANNNALLEKGDSNAVENSIPVDYIVLPVPTFGDSEQAAQGAVDGYICLTGTANSDEQHMKNVAEFIYYLASSERAAQTCQELYLKPVCETGKEAYAKLEPIANKNENNTAAVENLTQYVAEARPDIPAELGAKAIKIEDEVIVPKFQGLLAGEVSPEEMYQAIVDAGHEQFGESGCVVD